MLLLVGACRAAPKPPPQQEPLVLATGGPIVTATPDAALAEAAHAPAEPMVPGGPSRYCTRGSDGCWDCVDMQFPEEIPCLGPTPGCNGICVHAGPHARCAPASHVCCASGACETPPITGDCEPECGDPSGDKKNDRCLVPASCPYKKQLDDFFGVYQVVSPPELFETLCAQTLPTTFPSDFGDDAKSACGPQNVIWTVHPRAVAKGSSGGGPAICFGKVRVSTVGTMVDHCGKYHCQTLRTCDGVETPEHCSVLGECAGGKLVGKGFSW